MSLLEQLRQNRAAILTIADRYGATNLRVFGSVARGDDRPDSDIDLLVDLQRTWTLFDHISMMQDLEDLLKHKVDVAVAKGLKERFRDRILEEAIVL
ncbi:nucleotidyltransferase family protein [Alkalinema pantanalense CENA528]|uniref:nucleotidyltransferase family protein n=1 Tax=Alkalinema pantanalense TaxID=1620705 RepID=UPI003D6DE911